MKLNKRDKLSISITIMLFIFGALITILFFSIGQKESSKGTDAILDSIQENCGDKPSLCQNETYYISEDDISGGCAYFKTDMTNSTSLKEGALIIRVKLSDVINTENGYEWSNGTLGLGGEEPLNKDKRFIADFIDKDNRSFLELYIDKYDIVKARFVDKDNKEFILSSKKINISEWNDIILVWSENDKIELVINDNLESNVQFNHLNFDYYPNEIYFGANINKRYCLNGYIDEIRVYNKMPQPI